MKTNYNFKSWLWKKSNRAAFLLIALLLFGCSGKKPEGARLTKGENAKLSQALRELNLTDNGGKTLLIIPVEGCSVCIDFALGYISAHHPVSNTFLPILSSKSSKAISLALSTASIGSKDVIIDEKGIALKHNLATIHPVIIRILSDEESYLVKIDPDNMETEIEKLRNELAEK
jgi:hypothetical protein